MATRAARPEPPQPKTWIDVDLGDGAIVVIEYPDGMFRLTLDDQSVVMTEQQMRDIVTAFEQFALLKNWR